MADGYPSDGEDIEVPVRGAFAPNQARNVPHDRHGLHLSPDPDSVGNSTRFFGGVLAPDSRRCVYCVVFLLLATILFTYLWLNTEGKHKPWFVITTWVLFALEMTILIRTTLLNPGIARKASAPRPSDEDRRSGRDFQFVRFKKLTLPMPYCYTCELVREPRMSHCAVCNNCVRRFDHHCTFIGACIGQGNFGHFYALLLTSTVSMYFVIGVMLYYMVHFWHAASAFDEVLAVVLILGAAFIGLNTTLMTINYTRLIAIGHTYREDAKRRTLPNPELAYNPFDNGFWSNFLEFVCYREPSEKAVETLLES